MARNNKKYLYWTVAVVVALLAAAATVFGFSFGKYESVKASAGAVSIQPTKISDGKAHFYRYEDGGMTITFFVVKATDGSYRAAFDACDSCYKSKKGYEQQGDKMNCRNCNQKFAINRLGPNATGGCNPGYLPLQQNGSTISIRVDDLKAGVHYF